MNVIGIVLASLQFQLKEITKALQCHEGKRKIIIIIIISKQACEDTYPENAKGKDAFSISWGEAVSKRFFFLSPCETVLSLL